MTVKIFRGFGGSVLGAALNKFKILDYVLNIQIMFFVIVIAKKFDHFNILLKLSKNSFVESSTLAPNTRSSPEASVILPSHFA